MILSEYVQKMNPKDIVYLGGYQSSGYIYIGIAAMIPLRCYNAEVMDTYPHDTDYPGTTVLIESDEAGKYWFYSECNPKAKEPTCELRCSDEKLMDLVIGIARQCAADFRMDIRSSVKKYKSKHGGKISPKMFQYILNKCEKRNDLRFLEGTDVGQNVIQTIKDEEAIMLLHPELAKMDDYDKRYKLIKEYISELKKERVRINEVSQYATIKGRSVWHG